MNSASKARFGVYLGLAIIGFVTAMYFNALAVISGEDYGKAWTSSAADLVLTSDLSIVAIAAGVFMIVEGKRVGMKHAWVFIAISAVTAMAFTFPLFLAMREKRIAAKGN
ncbi:MAG: DUF2834 domain-containing protein [Micrococcales bacterium]